MKHYTEAANKLMGLLRSETDESRKQIFMKHLNESISSAGFLKTIIKDKKNALKSQQSNLLKPSKQPVGIGCLGA